MKNIPYKKETDEFGNVINLSKENPYLNKFKKTENKRAFIYLILSDGSKIKNRGNNRSNKSKRPGKHSRLYQRFINA